MRIGHSYDIHPLAKNYPFFLGGIKIDYDFGPVGHSDADVLLHVIAESLIGAMGLGDLGTFFSDTDQMWAGIESWKLLKIIISRLSIENYEIQNIDTIVFLEQPKLLPYIPRIKNHVSSVLGISPTQVNIKSTTHEQKGFIGRQEAIAAEAVVLIKQKE